MALEADRKQSLQINADRVFFDHRTATNTYEGHVKLVQGTTELTANTILVSFDAQDQIEKIVAKGTPACYRTLFALEKPEVVATGSAMEYYPQKNILRLEGCAKITEGENSFEGSQIEYNTQEKIVTSAISNQGQIHITLRPHKKPSNS